MSPFLDKHPAERTTSLTCASMVSPYIQALLDMIQISQMNQWLQAAKQLKVLFTPPRSHSWYDIWYLLKIFLWSEPNSSIFDLSVQSTLFQKAFACYMLFICSLAYCCLALMCFLDSTDPVPGTPPVQVRFFLSLSVCRLMHFNSSDRVMKRWCF